MGWSATLVSWIAGIPTLFKRLRHIDMIAVISCLFAVGSFAIAWRALDYTRHIREIDEERDKYISYRTRRDALLRMKLQVYVEYARGSLKTFSGFTYALAEKKNPTQILSRRRERALFRSYLYDVQLGIKVGHYCASEMFAPVSEDFKEVYRLENDYMRLQRREFTLLDAIGIPMMATADSIRDEVSHVIELNGPYMSIMPLPATDLAMPLAKALEKAEDAPAGWLQARGDQIFGNARLRLWYPWDGRLADSMVAEGKVKWFWGRFRYGEGMASETYDFYKWGSPAPTEEDRNVKR